MNIAARDGNGPLMIAEICRSVNERIREVELGWTRMHDFVCECEDAGCTRAIRMDEHEYEALRSGSWQFAVLPGHEQTGSDEVVLRTERYLIITKGKGFNAISELALT